MSKNYHRNSVIRRVDRGFRNNASHRFGTVSPELIGAAKDVIMSNPRTQATAIALFAIGAISTVAATALNVIASNSRG